MGLGLGWGWDQGRPRLRVGFRITRVTLKVRITIRLGITVRVGVLVLNSLEILLNDNGSMVDRDKTFWKVEKF
jgi:hypothetical protein